MADTSGFLWKIPIAFNYTHPLKKKMSKYELQLWTQDRDVLLRNEVVTEVANSGTKIEKLWTVSSWTWNSWYVIDVRVCDEDDVWTMFSEPISVFCGEFGHEALKGLLPEGNPEGEHYHLTRAQWDMLGSGNLSLVAPADGQIFSFVSNAASRDIPFEWEYDSTVPGLEQVGFDLELSESADFSGARLWEDASQIGNIPGRDTRKCKTGHLSIGPSGTPDKDGNTLSITAKTYFARIRVINSAGGRSGWSNRRQFSIAILATPPTPPPTPTYPPSSDRDPEASILMPLSQDVREAPIDPIWSPWGFKHKIIAGASPPYVGEKSRWLEQQQAQPLTIKIRSEGLQPTDVMTFAIAGYNIFDLIEDRTDYAIGQSSGVYLTKTSAPLDNPSVYPRTGLTFYKTLPPGVFEYQLTKAEYDIATQWAGYWFATNIANKNKAVTFLCQVKTASGVYSRQQASVWHHFFPLEFEKWIDANNYRDKKYWEIYD